MTQPEPGRPWRPCDASGAVALRPAAGTTGQPECLESLQVLWSELVRGHTRGSTAAPRRLQAGARAAGLGLRYHHHRRPIRRQGALRVTAPILRRDHSRAQFAGVEAGL